MNILLLLKIICIVCLFLAAVSFGLTPIILRKLTKFAKLSKFIKYILIFSQGLAAGILLGGGLLHLIPDATESIVSALTDMHAADWVIGFPYAPFISILTLLLIFFCENSVKLYFVHKKNKKKKLKCDEYTDGTDEEKSSLIVNTKKSEKYMSINGNGKSHEHDEHDHDHDDQKVHSHDLDLSLNVIKEGTIIEKLIGAIFLWISLSLHSFFVGLALGSTNDQQRFWIILIAIIAHKSIASYALGIELDSSNVNKYFFVILIVLFSCSTPTGTIVGICFTMISDQTVFVLISAVFIAMSAGAFIHVSIFEFLFEFVHENKKFVSFSIFTLLFLIGFGIMAVLSFWT